MQVTFSTDAAVTAATTSANVAKDSDDANSASNSREQTLTPAISASTSFSEAESTDTLLNEAGVEAAYPPSSDEPKLHEVFKD